MSKLTIAVISLCLMATFAVAGTVSVPTIPAGVGFAPDNYWRNGSTDTFISGWGGETELRLGTDRPGFMTGVVLPFELPVLGAGESISAASIDMWVRGENWLQANPQNVYEIVINGVRVETSISGASPTMLQTDINIGTAAFSGATGVFLDHGPNGIPFDPAGPNGNKALQQNLNLTTAGLGAYLQGIYDGDPSAAGKFVVLSVVQDQNNANGFFLKLASGDDFATNPVPTLNLDIIPEPATLALLLGALPLAAMLRRRR